MYLCICNGIPQKDVEVLLKQGKTVEEIQSLTGCGTECGICLNNLWSLAGKEKKRGRFKEKVSNPRDTSS